jgi:hypothetical protein
MPVGVQHLEADDVRAGRNAGAAAVRVVAAAGNDAGDVGAMAVRVRRPRARHVPGEILEAGDAVRCGGGGADVEVVVPGGHAGIDHGDADADAGDGELFPGRRGADRGAGALDGGERLAVEDYARDPWIAGQIEE